MSDYVDALAEFALKTRYEDIPPAVLEHAKLILSDTLPVIASGMQEQEMRALVERHLPRAASGSAAVIGTGRKAGPLDAAMLNSMAGVWNELDEGHFYTNGHPGIHVIPAVLAHAQEHGLSGKDLLAALVVGYEVAGRIGGAYRMRVIVQTHGTFGVTGSTAAVGRMSGLTHREMREAINIAASTPLGGNRQTMVEGSTVRNYYPGHANFTGQMAVRLAQSGFTAPRDSASVTYSQILADDFKPEKAATRLNEWWLITDNYIKLYPSARYVHCAIDALHQALAQAPGGKVDAGSVDRVEVYGYRMLVFCGNPRPTTMFGTHFSTPFSIATILVHGRADLDVFGEQAFKNPAVLELATRVNMIEVPEMNANFPAEIPARVKVVMKDGTSYEGSVKVPKGERANQHSGAELERKFYQLATPVWGEALSRRVRESCLTVERLANARELAGGAAL